VFAIEAPFDLNALKKCAMILSSRAECKAKAGPVTVLMTSFKPAQTWAPERGFHPVGTAAFWFFGRRRSLEEGK